MFSLEILDVKLKFKGSFLFEDTATFEFDDWNDVLKIDKEEKLEYQEDLAKWNKDKKWEIDYYVTDIPKELTARAYGSLDGHNVTIELAMDLQEYYKLLIPDLVDYEVESDGCRMFEIYDDLTDIVGLYCWDEKDILTNRPRRENIRYSATGGIPESSLTNYDDFVYQHIAHGVKKHEFGDFAKDYTIDEMVEEIRREELNNGWNSIDIYF